MKSRIFISIFATLLLVSSVWAQELKTQTATNAETKETNKKPEGAAGPSKDKPQQAEQPGVRKGTRPEKKSLNILEELDAKFKFSAEQMEKVQGILQNTAKKFQELNAKNDPPAQKRPAISTIVTTTANEIEAILNEKQKPEFAKMKNDWINKRISDFENAK